MNKNRDITSTLILIFILLIISGLIFYLFFYQGSHQASNFESPKTDQVPPSSPTDTKYKGKGVYIIDPRAKIRSEPDSNATVVAEKKRCERVTVKGAWGDWFEVDYDSEKNGWILREQVSDRDPCKKKPEKPSKDDNTYNNYSSTPEESQSLDQTRADMDNLIASINQLAVNQFSQEMFTGFEIREAGKKLTLYVSKAWYILPPVQKQILFNRVAITYAQQTCFYKIRTECNADDFPTINFLNPDNREVARMAAHQPLQIFE